jgi:hypothetical protein
MQTTKIENAQLKDDFSKPGCPYVSHRLCLSGLIDMSHEQGGVGVGVGVGQTI